MVLKNCSACCNVISCCINILFSFSWCVASEITVNLKVKILIIKEIKCVDCGGTLLGGSSSTSSVHTADKTD